MAYRFRNYYDVKIDAHRNVEEFIKLTFDAVQYSFYSFHLSFQITELLPVIEILGHPVDRYNLKLSINFTVLRVK